MEGFESVECYMVFEAPEKGAFVVGVWTYTDDATVTIDDGACMAKSAVRKTKLKGSVIGKNELGWR